MLNIIICGINGEMGLSVYRRALINNHNVICGIDKSTVGITDCPVFSDFDQIRHLADVIIDFSAPDVTSKLLKYATENSMPLVIGTTGHSEKQEHDILNASNIIPVFKSANMSLGINLLIKLCKEANFNLSGFDVEIIEKHHKNKLDSPSGTAKLIIDGINENCNPPKSPIFGRLGQSKRTSGEIGVHSVRGGSTVGEHSVSFFGEYESITLTHTAYSKDLFAQGAIKACEFITKQKNGLFDMQKLI